MRPHALQAIVITLALSYVSIFGQDSLSEPLFVLPGTFAPRHIEPLPGLFDSLPAETTDAFTSGYAAFLRADYDTAIARLDSAARQTRLLRPYVHALRLQTLLHLGRTQNALSAFDSIDATEAPHAQQDALLALLRSSQIPPSAALTERIRKCASVKSVPELAYKAGLTYISMRDTAEAIRYWTAVIRRKRFSIFSDSAFYRCRSLTGPSPALLASMAAYLDSRIRFDSLYAFASPLALQKGSRQETFLKYAHKAAHRTRRYADALRILSLLEKKQGRTPYSAYYRALALEKLNNYHAARIAYAACLRDFPKSEWTDDILWDQARRFEVKNDFSAAIRTYRRLYTECPRMPLADRSAFREAFCFYKAGMPDSAIFYFRSFSRRFPSSPLREGTAYWTGRSFEKKGQPDSAKAALTESALNTGFSFYAFRAKSRLEQAHTVTAPFLLPEQRAMSIEASLDSLKSRSEIRAAHTASAGSSFYRGLLLMRCGMPDWALQELRDAETPAHRDINRFVRLLRIYEQYGYFTDAYRLSRVLQIRLPDRLAPRLPAMFQRFFYPRYFGEAVDAESRKYGLSPLLVHSVIRQESAYDYHVMSPAGAIGLMQLMPRTAADAANKMQLFFAAESLYNPLYNIALGVYHLAELSDRFEGAFEWIFAAYNAGSGPSKTWRKNGEGRDWDEAIEDIAYSETRNYVKKCLRNLWTYEKVWNTGNLTQEPRQP